MNVLIEGMSRELGGMEAFIMSVYHNLDKENYHIDFVVYDEMIVFQEEILSSHSKIYYVTPRSVNALKSQNDLKMIFDKNHYDVFWSNKTTISNISALRAAYDARVPVRILHSHASENRGTKFTYMMHRKNRKPAVKYATELLACSAAAAQWMFGTDAGKAEILINGVDIKKYEYSPQREKNMRTQLGIGEEPVVGHVGRFSKEKNHEFIFAVFQEILKEEPKAILVLCGGGERLAKFQSEAEKLSIAEHIKFLGVRNDIPDVLQIMNAFLFPSLFEGYGIALIEAQAAGIPSFGSESVIPADVGITDKMHFLSLEKSPKIWAEAIAEVLHEPKKSDTEVLIGKDVSLEKMMKKVKNILDAGK